MTGNRGSDRPDQEALWPMERVAKQAPVDTGAVDSPLLPLGHPGSGDLLQPGPGSFSICGRSGAHVPHFGHGSGGAESATEQQMWPSP